MLSAAVPLIGEETEKNPCPETARSRALSVCWIEPCTPLVALPLAITVLELIGTPEAVGTLVAVT